MSFTTAVKQELNRIAPERICCKTAQLAALFRGAGSFHLQEGGRYGIHAAFGLSATARSAVSLIKSFDLSFEVRVREDRRLGQRKRFEIHLEGGQRLVQFLNEIGVLSDSLSLQEQVPQRIIERRCCRIAFLRGAFLAAGSINGPGSPSHLEIYSGNEAFLQAVQAAAGKLELKLSLVTRERYSAVYSKSNKTASDFLVTVGAHHAALEMEERAVISGLREDANRRANCDQANAERLSRAAARQSRAIKALLASDRWDGLSANLVEMAELRLKHPSLTLGELGQRLDPPLSKSAVNHRLRRLLALAEEAGL